MYCPVRFDLINSIVESNSLKEKKSTMDAEGLAKIRALSKRRNEAEEEDEEEETTRDRVRAQPGHGEHFLFAPGFSNGPIKKKRLEQAKSRL